MRASWKSASGRGSRAPSPSGREFGQLRALVAVRTASSAAVGGVADGERVERPRRLRPLLDRQLGQAHRLSRIAQRGIAARGEQPGEIVRGRDQLGIARERRAVLADRFRVPAEHLRRGAEQGIQSRGIGAERLRALERGARIREAPYLEQHAPAARVAGGVLRIQPQALLIALQRLGEVSALLEEERRARTTALAQRLAPDHLQVAPPRRAPALRSAPPPAGAG
jgi:hypothetical protein